MNRVPVDPGGYRVTDGLDELGADDEDMQGHAQHERDKFATGSRDARAFFSRDGLRKSTVIDGMAKKGRHQVQS